MVVTLILLKMSNKLTTPLIVPEYQNGIVKTYTPNPTLGDIVEAAYTIDIKQILTSLGIINGSDGKPAIATANSCVLNGNDLFVSISSGNSQGIIKFPKYLSDPFFAKKNASLFSSAETDYVGMAVDSSGNLYSTEGSFLNNRVIRYAGANPASRAVIGNAGATSYFGNMVFDATGNLWVTDYQNNRVVVFDSANLGGTNTFHILNNLRGAIPVANTNGSLKTDATIKSLFSQPEGIDRDASGNIWIANNNDGNTGPKNDFTSIVKITPAFQLVILGSNNTDPTLAGANNSYSIYQVPASASGQPQLGGLQIDRSVGRIFVNEEIAGKGRWYDIASIANISTSDTNHIDIVSTNPGNGGIALVTAVIPNLYIKDTAADTGSEPDTTTNRPWESVDIWVRQSADKQTAFEKVIGGAPCFVYVRVHNAGISPGAGNEQLKVYWGKGGSGLGWPTPWTSNNIMGGDIGTQTVTVIQPGQETIFEFPWTAPNPTDYTAMFPSESDHFCLLARVETSPASPFGMTSPEGADLFQNVVKNNKIAWVNIHITPTAKGMAGIIASNYTAAVMHATVSFELLNEEGQSTDPGTGKLMILTQGSSLEKLREASANSGHISYLGEGRFEVLDIRDGINNLTLSPGEVVPFNVEYTPATEQKGYALRVVQNAEEGNIKKVVGGQTIIFGKVKGFPAPETTTKKSPYWWCLFLSIFTLLFFFLIKKGKKHKDKQVE